LFGVAEQLVFHPNLNIFLLQINFFNIFGLF